MTDDEASAAGVDLAGVRAFIAEVDEGQLRNFALAAAQDLARERRMRREESAAIEARVRAEVAEEQRKIAAATRRLTTALLANESLLQTPFTDQPELTPWTRSVKPALEALRAAVAAGSSRDTTPEG